MKYLVFNRSFLLFSSLVFSALSLNAQIKSTHTDEKYNYTTVVYKDSTATDKDVLSALENSIGMGDVVRVTVAPPKPAVVPSIDKNKGEDVWLKPANRTPVNLTASAASGSANFTVAKPVVVSPKTTQAAPNPAPATVKQSVNQTVAAPDNLEQNNMQAVATIEPAPAPVMVKAKSVGAVKTAKSSKSTVKKSARKSSGTYKMKNRKKGKQRYSCPKF